MTLNKARSALLILFMAMTLVCSAAIVCADSGNSSVQVLRIDPPTLIFHVSDPDGILHVIVRDNDGNVVFDASPGGVQEMEFAVTFYDKPGIKFPLHLFILDGQESPKEDHWIVWDDGSAFLQPEQRGGTVVAINKLGLLAPYIGLASAITMATAATAICARRVRRRKEKQ